MKMHDITALMTGIKGSIYYLIWGEPLVNVLIFFSL